MISCWSKGTLQPSHAICWHGKQGKWLCRCKKVSETGLWVLLLQTTEGLGFYIYTSCLSSTRHCLGLALVGLHWSAASLLPPTPVSFLYNLFLRQRWLRHQTVHKGVSIPGFGTVTVEDFCPAFCIWKQKRGANLPSKPIGCKQGWGQKILFEIKSPLSKQSYIEGRKKASVKILSFNNFSVQILWTFLWMWNISVYTVVFYFNVCSHIWNFWLYLLWITCLILSNRKIQLP